MKKIKEKMKAVRNWFTNVKNKIKWFVTEIMNMYSAHDSHFSKKRVESGVAFLIAQFGMVFFLVKKIDTMDVYELSDTMDVYELSIWAGMEFLIAGYTVTQIQKEKKNKVVEEPSGDEPQLLND
jgi:hypothetical protein